MSETIYTKAQADALLSGKVSQVSGQSPDANGHVDLSALYGARSKPTATQFLAPLGVVTFRQDTNYKFLAWNLDGSKIYAADTSSAGARTVAVSTDNGATWTKKTAPDATYSPNYAWVTSAGTLLVITGYKLYRSTDDGATWTLPLTLLSDEVILNDGLVQDPSGNLYAGVYASGGTNFYTNGAPVYESTDDGVTWTVHSTFPSTMKGATSPPAIRHIHGMHASSSGLFAMTGDSPSESGIWKWGGSSWTKLTPTAGADNYHRFTAVSVQERGGYLYWALDTNADDVGAVMKAPISDMTAWTELAALPTSSYYSTTMPDGTMLFGGAMENGATGITDDTMRIWAVDADDNVYEAWSAPVHTDTGANQPLHSLRAHPTKGTVLFYAASLMNYATPTTAAQFASFLGYVRRGTDRKPERVQALQVANVTKKLGTVNNPSTTNTSASTPDVLETLTVDLKGKSVLILWGGTFAQSTQNARLTVGPAVDGLVPATADTRSFVAAVANEETTLGGSAVVTFSAAGQHTINLIWYVTSGTGYAQTVKRSLIAIELPN